MHETATNSGDPNAPRSSTARARLRQVLSLPVIYGAILVLLVCAASRVLVVNGDTWWHLFFGEQILTSGTWPTSDSNSFTAQREAWMAYEWLGEVLMALAMRHGHLGGIALLLAALSASFVVLLYLYGYLASGNARASFVSCLMLFPLIVPFLVLRPQLVGYILLLLVLVCLERHYQGKAGALRLVPFIFLCWVNIHGSFMMGFGACVVYWLGGIVPVGANSFQVHVWSKVQRHRLAMAMLLSLAAMMITPYSYRLFLYPLGLIRNQPFNIANILEWQPLGFNQWWGRMFLLLVLAFFLSQILFAQRYRLDQIVLLLFGIYAAARHGRFLIVFVIFFVPPLAVLLSRWLTGLRSAEKLRWNAAFLVTIAIISVWIIPSGAHVKNIVQNRFPSETLEYLRKNPGVRRTFNELEWGGYLIWSLGRTYPVFIDGRTDFYENAGVLQDYFAIAQAKQTAPRLIDRYRLDAFLLPHGTGLATVLAVSGQWKKVCQDPASELYLRRIPLPGPDDSSSQPVLAGVMSRGTPPAQGRSVSVR